MKWLLVVFLLLGQSACISTKYIPVQPSEPAIAYLAQADQSNLSKYAPVFLIDESDLLYNRIGTPSVTARFLDNDSNGHSITLQRAD